jgi:hypothetical protein
MPITPTEERLKYLSRKAASFSPSPDFFSICQTLLYRYSDNSNSKFANQFDKTKTFIFSVFL